MGRGECKAEKEGILVRVEGVEPERARGEDTEGSDGGKQRVKERRGEERESERERKRERERDISGIHSER